MALPLLAPPPQRGPALGPRRCAVWHLPSRRCLTGVDSRSKGSSKFVSVDEESNREIMHVLRLGEAQRAAYQALDPGAWVYVKY